MKMIKVEELHKEVNGNSYTRSTYMVGRYEVCIDDAAYADGRSGSARSTESSSASTNPRFATKKEV